MAKTETDRPRRPRLLDLVGLVVGYGMAATLARSFWPGTRPLVGFPAVALVLEYVWLGLAMSGPIVLLLDRRGGPAPARKRPPRPGRPISSKEPVDPPVGRGSARAAPSEAGPYTGAEVAWMLIGGYWIALTLFLVPMLPLGQVSDFIGLIQLVIAGVLLFAAPRRAKPAGSAGSWTHAAALTLLWTWPIAWVLLILLTRSF